jgi:hypothetical protein
VITFLGVTRSDDTLVAPSDVTADGVPIYERPSFGFSLVVEGRPGGSGAPVGTSTFNWNPTDPNAVPYLLIEVSRPLGDGSAAVCDDMPPDLGGVPAVNPPDFSAVQSVADAINDFACRFKDGTGFRSGRGTSDACIMFADGQFHFMKQGSTTQFCGQINRPLSFPQGDTLVTIRIRDLAGNVSEAGSLIIRVGGV